MDRTRRAYIKKRLFDDKRKTGIRVTALIGIVTHFLFSFFKIGIAIKADSAAIMADGIEGFSEAGSLVIILTGVVYSSKKPDIKHPMGYGRVEMISDLIISSIIIYASLLAASGAVKQIMHPVKFEFNFFSILVLSLSIPVKFILSILEKKRGKEYGSRALIAASKHSSHSIFLSASVLLTGVLDIWYDIDIEGFVAMAIALISLHHGVSMLRETAGDMLGHRIDRDYMYSIKDTICQTENVLGAYDLSLHNYGQGNEIGSVHIEVPAELTANQIDAMEREIFVNVFRKYNVILEGIGIYARDDQDPMSCEIRRIAQHCMEEDSNLVNVHGININRERKKINLDMVVKFYEGDTYPGLEKVRYKLQERYPEFQVNLREDIDL